jgi:gliding motility-associated-like protein
VRWGAGAGGGFALAVGEVGLDFGAAVRVGGRNGAGGEVTGGIINNTETTILTCTTPTVNVTATGGVSYLWSNGTTTIGTTAELSITTPGTYTVTVTAANGCSDTESIVITQDKSVTAGIINNTEKSVLTCTTPAISVTATGGVSYSWSNGSAVIGTAAELSITTPGTYTVTATSANGCTDTESVVITEDKSVTAGITNNTEKSVLTCTTPTISVTATGGASYSWSNGTATVGTAAELSITAPGTYTVTATSANGCSDTESIVITENKSVTAGITNNTATTILTCTTPTVKVTATGGASYSWSNGTSVTGTAAELSITAPGNYTVTATAANGCTDTKTVIITEDKSVTAGITNNTATTILTCTTPTVNVTANGGASYSWSNGTSVTGTAAELSITAPGTYTVTATAANGCIDTKTITITQPSALATTVTGQNNVLCFGGATGSATALATGGTSVYRYSWNTTPVQTTATATNLSAGSYTVTVTDANGCEKNAVVNISESLEPLSLTLISKGATRQGSIDGTKTLIVVGGSIRLAVVGGTAPFSYTWTGPGTFTSNYQDLTDLSGGTYNVIVTDANGCTKSISAIIEVQIIIIKDETCEIFVPNVFTPNADGVHDYFEIKCLYNYANAEIQIFNRNGNLLFKKDHYGNLDFWGSKDQAFWRGRSDNKLNFMGSELPVGTYYYILRLGNGKALTGFIFLGR